MANKYRKYSHVLFMGLYASLLLCVLILLSACRESVTPKPDGYFRIDPYPQTFRIDTIGGIAISVNDSARGVVPADRDDVEADWLNLTYPRYRATVYLSYIPIKGSDNLMQLLSESRELVYRQNVNTSAVRAVAYENRERALFATLYKLSAESATPLQFIATDSVGFLLRGVLYYDAPIRQDSVAPTMDFLEADMMQMIESVTPIQE